MNTAAVALPPVLTAVIVYFDRVVTAEGVPPIAPVAAPRLSPAGSAGVTLYETTVPPLFVGLFGVIGVLMTYVAVPAA
jgi:hypothetical protein